MTAEERLLRLKQDGIVGNGDHEEIKMTQPFGTQPAYQRTPLSAEEKAQGEANFAPYVADALMAKGRFRVTADTPEMVELFQKVARRVSDTLRRPVVSYANGRDILITFSQEASDLTGRAARAVEE